MKQTRNSITPLFGELLRYGFVSAAALVVDFCCLLLLAQVLHYLLAASLSFILGGVVAYLLSVRYVFKHRRIAQTSAELGAFIALGLIGLAVNIMIMTAAVEYWGLSLAPSKMAAAGGTFACNFALRKLLLFTRIKTDIETGALPVG